MQSCPRPRSSVQCWPPSPKPPPLPASAQAFSRLLEKKRYESITVQEIIDEANIGRSTFYSHFETKDELLRSLCADIFHHVFTQKLPQETECGVLLGSKDLELKLGHILYHLDEHRSDLAGILSGESGELFMQTFRSHMRDLFLRCRIDLTNEAPADFLLNHLIGSFAEAAKWWIIDGKSYSPHQVAGFFMAAIESRSQHKNLSAN